MGLAIETEREVDGRWLAEVPALPGTMIYGQTREEVITRVEVMALRRLDAWAGEAIQGLAPGRSTGGHFS